MLCYFIDFGSQGMTEELERMGFETLLRLTFTIEGGHLVLIFLLPCKIRKSNFLSLLIIKIRWIINNISQNMPFQ